MPELGLTRELAKSIATLDIVAVPDVAIRTVQLAFTDCIGTLIAGSAEPAVALISQATEESGLQEARLLPGSRRCSARQAALVNGVAAHVLDYDDVALDGHPSAVLVPAVLAEGEAIGALADDLVRGYIAGYETWAALRVAVGQPLHSRGWHPTSVYGCIAAAAACAALRHLPAKAVASALALAAAQASGIVANFGSMAKPFQVGRAAESGLLAARLAAAGVTGASDALEHEHGLIAALCGSNSGRIATGGSFGFPDWAIARERLNIKNYPMCYATHRIIDGALELRRSGALEPAAIERIDLHVGRIQLEILRHHTPATALEAKFSAEFGVSAAIIADGVGLQELSDDFVRRDDVRALIKKVVCHPIEETRIGDEPFSPYDQVMIQLTNGRQLSGRRVEWASGGRDNPPTRAQLWKKFNDNVSPHLDSEVASRLFEELQALGGRRQVKQILDMASLSATTQDRISSGCTSAGSSAG